MGIWAKLKLQNTASSWHYRTYNLCTLQLTALDRHVNCRTWGVHCWKLTTYFAWISLCRRRLSDHHKLYWPQGEIYHYVSESTKGSAGKCNRLAGVLNPGMHEKINLIEKTHIPSPSNAGLDTAESGMSTGKRQKTFYVVWGTVQNSLNSISPEERPEHVSPHGRRCSVNSRVTGHAPVLGQIRDLLEIRQRLFGPHKYLLRLQPRASVPWQLQEWFFFEVHIYLFGLFTLPGWLKFARRGEVSQINDSCSILWLQQLL